jgi:hypothetical protein
MDEKRKWFLEMETGPAQDAVNKAETTTKDSSLFLTFSLCLMFSNCPVCPIQNNTYPISTVTTSHLKEGAEATSKVSRNLNVLQIMSNRHCPMYLYSL